MPHTDDTKQAAAYTPEPWDCDGRTTLYAMPHEGDEITMIEVRGNVTEAGWDTVAFVEAIWPGSDANARRICAAVNACAGIPTEALEQGVVRELLGALRWLVDDLADAEEDSNPETGEEYDSVAHARAAIAQATRRGRP